MENPIKYLGFTGMLNMNSSDFLTQDSELSICKNCYMYKNGVIEKVPGYEKEDLNQFVTTQNITFLHYYYDSNNFNKYIIAGSKNSADTYYNIKYITNLGSTASSGYTAFTGDRDIHKNAVLCATNYLSKAFIVGHSGNTEAYVSSIGMMTVDGTTLASTSAEDSDLLNAPSGRYITRYRDLLYVLNASDGSNLYPNRAYFNDDPVSGAITWTNATNFLDFGQDDGDEITGAAVAYDRLIVFKNESMWSYDETNIAQISQVGCIEHRTIQKINNNLFWTDGDAIYRWDGSQAINISKRIQPFMDAIDKSTFGNRLTRPFQLFATRYNNEYRLHVGDVTYEGDLYENAWICYDTIKDTFYIRCTYHECHSATTFLADSDQTLLTMFGSSSGYSYTFRNRYDEIYSDDSKEIDSFFATKDIDFGYPEAQKFSSDIVFFTKNAQGMNCHIKLDDKNYYEKHLMTIVRDNIHKYNLNEPANLYKFRFSERSDKQSWKFKGFIVDTKLIEKQTNG